MLAGASGLAYWYLAIYTPDSELASANFVYSVSWALLFGGVLIFLLCFGQGLTSGHANMEDSAATKSWLVGLEFNPDDDEKTTVRTPSDMEKGGIKRRSGVLNTVKAAETGTYSSLKSSV